MGPTYRFWGRTPPKPGTRTPIVAASPAPATDDQPTTAVLRIYDPIDSWGGEWGVSAKEFIAALDTLPENTTDIELRLNSPGGEVFEAVTILNALRRHTANVTAYVDGLAASAASFLAAGADTLVMGGNTQLMIHDAWGLCVGNEADMTATAALLGKLSDNIAEVYAAKSGTDVTAWRTAMLAESWYGPDEAVAAGLADRVEGEKAPDAKAFDTQTLFAHAGRADAPAPVIPTAPAARADTPTEDTHTDEVAAARARAHDVRHRMATRRARRAGLTA